MPNSFDDLVSQIHVGKITGPKTSNNGMSIIPTTGNGPAEVPSPDPRSMYGLGMTALSMFAPNLAAAIDIGKRVANGEKFEAWEAPFMASTHYAGSNNWGWISNKGKRIRGEMHPDATMHDELLARGGGDRHAGYDQSREDAAIRNGWTRYIVNNSANPFSKTWYVNKLGNVPNPEEGMGVWEGNITAATHKLPDVKTLIRENPHVEKWYVDLVDQSKKSGELNPTYVLEGDKRNIWSILSDFDKDRKLSEKIPVLGKVMNAFK